MQDTACDIAAGSGRLRCRQRAGSASPTTIAQPVLSHSSCSHCAWMSRGSAHGIDWQCHSLAWLAGRVGRRVWINGLRHARIATTHLHTQHDARPVLQTVLEWETESFTLAVRALAQLLARRRRSAHESGPARAHLAALVAVVGWGPRGARSRLRSFQNSPQGRLRGVQGPSSAAGSWAPARHPHAARAASDEQLAGFWQLAQVRCRAAEPPPLPNHPLHVLSTWRQLAATAGCSSGLLHGSPAKCRSTPARRPSTRRTALRLPPPPPPPLHLPFTP